MRAEFMVIDRHMNTLIIPGNDANLLRAIGNHKPEVKSHGSRNQFNKEVDTFVRGEESADSN